MILGKVGLVWMAGFGRSVGDDVVLLLMCVIGGVCLEDPYLGCVSIRGVDVSDQITVRSKPHSCMDVLRAGWGPRRASSRI